MKNSKSGLIWLLVFIVMGQIVVAQDEQPRIAVLDFQSIGCEEDLGRATSEILRTELGSIGKYRIIERAQLLKVMEEQKLQLSGAVDEQTAVEIGKMLGAKMVVVGSIVRIGTTFTLNSRFIDVQTAEVKKSRNIRGNSEDEISNMCSSLAKLISDDSAVYEKPTSAVPNMELGSIWLVQESSFTAIWTRRGKSNIFDAVWFHTGKGLRAELIVMNKDNQTIVIQRVDNGKVLGMYKGNTANQGRNFRGSVTWSDKVSWTADVFSVPPGTGSSRAEVWIIRESDYTGIWRQIGTSNNFEATYFPNKLAAVRAELLVESSENGAVKIRRTDEGNKVLGYYYGSFTTDQTHLNGAADWSKNAVWSAEVFY